MTSSVDFLSAHSLRKSQHQPLEPDTIILATYKHTTEPMPSKKAHSWATVANWAWNEKEPYAIRPWNRLLALAQSLGLYYITDLNLDEFLAE